MPTDTSTTSLNLLTSLHADALALLAKLQAAGQELEGDAATVLKTVEATVAAGISQIATVVGGQALTDLQKIEQTVAAELQSQLPLIIQAVTTALLAALKSAATAAAVVAK